MKYSIYQEHGKYTNLKIPLNFYRVSYYKNEIAKVLLCINCDTINQYLSSNKKLAFHETMFWHG